MFAVLDRVSDEAANSVFVFVVVATLLFLIELAMKPPILFFFVLLLCCFCSCWYGQFR